MLERISRKKGEIIKRHWKAIYERDGENCAECGGRMISPFEHRNLKGPVNRGRNPAHQRALKFLRFSFGHVKPIVDGGEDVLENLVGEHFWCNKEKGSKCLKLPEDKILGMRSYAGKYIPKLLDYLK